eukprot:TRINITY_DN15798_c0_g1_i1.p1 TRINITY_DN15798_c0_g1~~TRINITY_DN15798_c0_g1_i1.p1  ORF type:complete len:397 (+),score=66.96 TRINITY_DN15798_c0_g1_i1:88-1278(+)
MKRRPPRSTLSSSSAASDVYKRQVSTQSTGEFTMGDGFRAALWVVNKSLWHPTQSEFDHLTDDHCDIERAIQVRRFKFTVDQHRALLSTLLQRKACCDIAGVPWADVVIARTKGSKPYCVLAPEPHRPNFSFNASHDGEYVVLVAHSHYLCGIDVLEVRFEKERYDFLFDTASPASRAYLDALPVELQGNYAQLLFSCKEAYTKAVGVGLFLELTDITFEPNHPGWWAECQSDRVAEGMFTVMVSNDGVQENRGEWCFSVQWLPGQHLVVSCMGSPKWAIDAQGGFKSQFLEPELCPSTVDGQKVPVLVHVPAEGLVPAEPMLAEPAPAERVRDDGKVACVCGQRFENPLQLREHKPKCEFCLLYTSDAADEEDSVDLGGRRFIKKKNNKCERRRQ